MSAVEYTEEELEERGRAVFSFAEDDFEARAIGEAIARRFGLTYREMVGPMRRGAAPRARSRFYVALVERGWTYSRIGRFVGRDHTTVMAALRSNEGHMP